MMKNYTRRSPYYASSHGSLFVQGWCPSRTHDGVLRPLTVYFSLINVYTVYCGQAGRAGRPSLGELDGLDGPDEKTT